MVGDQKTTARHFCSHTNSDGSHCEKTLPKGIEIPAGWTVVRVEEYKEKNVEYYFAYLCPSHIISSTEKQSSLFEQGDKVPA